MGWDWQTIKHLLTTRNADYRNAFWLFIYLFLVITSLMIGKSVSTTLFISQFGALSLPYAIIGQTIVITLLIAIYLRLAHVFQPALLISMTLLFLATNALVLWGMLHFHLPGTIPILYMWGGIYGVIAPMQVWTVGNFIFSTRDARRYFGFIGSGGILGFICGGYLSQNLAPQIGTKNLLPTIAIFSCIAAILVQYIWQQNSRHIEELQNSAPTSEAPVSLRQSARLIKDSKYLLLITALVTIASLATKIVDVQFSAITQKFIHNEDEMTAFFGRAYTYMGWGAFFLQLFLGGKMLDKLGIGVTILILPISLLTSSLTALLFTALWTAVLLRMSDQVFKHSIDKSTTELLYLPIPGDIKFQVKTFIDTIVLRAGDGVAAFILIFFTHVIPLIDRARPGWISLLNLPIILLLLYVALQIRREYLNALRSGFKKRGLDSKNVSQYISQPSTLQKLKKYLESRQNEDILYALELMSQGEESEVLLLPHLQKLIHHASPIIRLKALQMLSTFSRDTVVPEVEELLDDPDLDIRAEAARYVYTYCQTDLLTRIESLPNYPNQVIQGGILLHLLSQNRADNLPVAQIFLDRMLENKEAEGTPARLEAARVLGRVSLPVKWHHYLIDLLQDDAPEVVREALASAGKSQHHDFIPFLLEALQERRTQVAAREALVHYGSRIFGTLKDHLQDAAVSLEMRRHIPRVLSRIGGQEAVQILLACLEQPDVTLRYKILKALNRLRASEASLQFDEHKVLNQLFAELRHFYWQSQLLAAINPAAGALPVSGGRQEDLLTLSLQEQQEEAIERLFRLLGLIYPHNDIHQAYFGLRSQRMQVRANTVEFMDNLLPPALRKFILPIIDSKVTLSQRVRKGRTFWKWKPISREEALTQLLNTSDRWLCACAIYATGQLRLPRLLNSIQSLAQSPDALLSETARLVLKQPPAQQPTDEDAYQLV
jgi:ATP:ADP antiporter, AAA family